MNEDKTFENDVDLEVNQPSHEDDSNTEGEAEETSESGESDTVTFTRAELEEKLKERDKRWKERLKNATKGDEESHSSSEEGGKESHQTNDKALQDRLDRADLRAEGVKDKKEQDKVLEYAKAFKLDVLDALERPAVKAEIKAIRDKASTPSPTGRTRQTDKGDVDYWVDQFKKGVSAPDLEMRRKVRAKLSQK